jgi:hypothetical protein
MNSYKLRRDQTRIADSLNSMMSDLQLGPFKVEKQRVGLDRVRDLAKKQCARCARACDRISTTRRYELQAL